MKFLKPKLRNGIIFDLTTNKPNHMAFVNLFEGMTDIVDNTRIHVDTETWELVDEINRLDRSRIVLS